MAMPDWEQYPQKRCLINYELDINVLVFFVNFHLRFFCERDLRISCLHKAMEKLTDINTF